MSLDRFRPKKASPDYLYIGLMIALIAIGLMMISSASVVLSVAQTGTNYSYVMRQLESLAIGAILFIIVSRIDYHVWEKYATHLMLVGLFLLLVIFVPGVGHGVNGAHRWINISWLQLQPSEFMKTALIVYLASWLEKRRGKLNNWSSSFWPFAIMLLVVGALIMAQPDLGTFSLIALTAIVMYFAAGAPLSYFVIGGGGGLAAAYALIVSSPYRMDRVKVYLGQDGADTLGTGYHIRQSLIAIGAGGWWGRGFGNSLQKYLYLPEPHTDSIFAITVEELGYVRASAILFLIAAFIYKGYAIANRAGDGFGRMLAFGITTSIAIQAVVNIGAMLGVLPLTGVPLPFISYGGTSLIATMVGVGIVANVSRQAYGK